MHFHTPYISIHKFHNIVHKFHNIGTTIKWKRVRHSYFQNVLLQGLSVIWHLKKQKQKRVRIWAWLNKVPWHLNLTQNSHFNNPGTSNVYETFKHGFFNLKDIHQQIQHQINQIGCKTKNMSQSAISMIPQIPLVQIVFWPINTDINTCPGLVF